MPLPWSREFTGRIDHHWFDAPALIGNPLGDPTRRPLWVWVPSGYDEDATDGRRWPVVYVLQSFAGQLDVWGNRKAFQPTYPELVDALEPACLVVFVDAWTSRGGSQFLDSSAIGRYRSYLVDDVVGFVDVHYATLSGPAHRGVSGHSSGGYGAVVSCLARPDVFGAFASHAGDALFEACYQPGFLETARVIGRSYGGSWDAFWEDIVARGLLTRADDFSPLNDWAMAACYSSDPDGTVHLPFDPVTGQTIPDVWKRWLAHDPVRIAATDAGAAALRSLVGMWIDAGLSDDVHLDLGAAALRDAVLAAGVAPDRLHFELFPGRHGGIEHRYPLALAWLAERLAPPPAQ